MNSNNVFYDVIKENLERGKDVSFVPTGDSMLPLIRGNKDRVFLSNTRVSKIAIGDIVLFSYNDSPTLHRIIEIIDSNNIVLKGDGNITVEKCSIEDIIAKVKYIKRGRLNIYNNSILWRIYILLWPDNKFFRCFFLFLYKLLTKKY